MYLFIFLAFVLLLGSLIHPRNQSLYLLCSYLTLLFLSAFRDINVGTDTEAYEAIFYQIVNYNNELLRVEYGWIFLNEIILFLGFDFRGVIVLSSFLTLTLIFLVVKKYSYNPMLSISLFYLLYFYFFSLNITRQLIAVSIVLFGIVLILRGKKNLFFLSVILASFFHQSAFIALIILFFNKIPNKKSFLILYIVISMVLGLFGVNLITKIIDYTGYSYYIENYSNNSLLGNSFLLILFNSFFLFLIFCIKEISREFKIFYFFIIMLNLTILIPFGGRFILYFSIYQILFYPYFIYSISQSNSVKLLSVLMILLYSFLIFFTSLGKGNILPYSNIFFDF